MPRKAAIQDFELLYQVFDPQFSPDGRRIAYTRKRVDVEKNSYRTEIWMTDMEGNEPRAFTTIGDTSAGQARWSPDGKQLAFVSDRKKPFSQIFLIPADGGEAIPLTRLTTEGAIHTIRWSPDGTKIAFVFRETPEAWRKETVEERKKKELPSPPRVHKQLFYRLDGFGYQDDQYTQIWAADVASGECKPLTEGPYNCQSPTWSPDSKTIAFLSSRREDNDIPPNWDDIWTVAADGGDLKQIPAPPGNKYALTWSPDGTKFAMLGSPDLDDQWGTRNERVLMLPSVGSETIQDLTGASDLEVGYATLSDVHEVGGDPLRWNSGSNALFFPISKHGDTRLAFIEVNGGQIVCVSPEDHEMTGFDITPDGKAAIVLSNAVTPQELFLLTHTGSEVLNRQLTHVNQGFTEELLRQSPEVHWLDNKAGGKVHTWLLKPVDFDPAKRYPLVLYVHGGPHAQYGNTFFHELQLLAAEGFAVLYTNPRGSKGYGEAHTRAIYGNWGGPDFDDIMTAADFAAEIPWVNSDRMAIMGGSYGGYMTAWAVGHTNRFHCAIADRLVGNLHSMSGTTDFPWHHACYYKGNAWDDPSDLWRCSPLKFAGKIETPLLLIHSDGDLRCPIGQAEELFEALRLQRKPVEFVRYPAETSHGLSRGGPPNLRVDRLERNLEWLHRHLDKV